MGKRETTSASFLTWNLYFGADLTPLIGAPANQIPERVTQVFRQFLATNYPVRVKAIAREIVWAKPDLIGLQEAARWQLVIPNVQKVTYDFVDLLLKELRNRGLHYKVAVLNKNLSVALPDSHGNTIRFLDRDVILIRKNKNLKIVKKQSANYSTSVQVPVGGQLLTILRGYSFVDVKKDGKAFRLINTHLEPASPSVRNSQATELLSGPAQKNMPMIITGDMNADPASDTYGQFITAGFQDVWNQAGKGDGFTAHQDADLLNAVSGLNARIDYIFNKNGWHPKKANLIGENQNDRTATGLWPSDHAGIAAKLQIKKC